MYYERVSFLDKLINTLLSPFDRFLFNDNKRSDEYMEILGSGRDIPKLSRKWIEYFYFAVHIKLFEILSVAYDGYEEQPDHVFVYVDTRLDDLFLELRSLWQRLDKYPFIQEKKLGQYDGFRSLNADSDFKRKLWIVSKQTLFEDINDLPKLSTIPLSNDLKSAFLEIDNLLLEHKKKKQTTLFGDGILEYEMLKFDLTKSTLTVNNSNPIPINQEIQVFAFLIMLIKSVGHVVTYDEITKTLGIGSDKSGRRNLQFIKRDIFNKFLELGFSKKVAGEIRDYVVFVRNQGATLKS
jgi:hypothetical protein